MQGTRSQSVSGLRSDAVGKAQYVLYMFCVVCGRLGELTKLRAYGFQFWFQVLGFQKRSSGRLQSTHHSQLAWECLTLIMILCFEFNTRKLCLTYDTLFINLVLVMF